MHLLKAEVERLRTRVADMNTLQLRVDNLTVVVEELRAQSSAAVTLSAEVKHLRDIVTSTQSRTTGGSTPLGSAFKSPAKKSSTAG